MSDPIRLEIPHQLGRAGARARVERGVTRLAEIVPGGVISDQHWEGDRFAFAVEAMGQRVTSRLDILDDRLLAEFDLPPLLAMFAGKIRDKLAREAPRMLE